MSLMNTPPVWQRYGLALLLTALVLLFTQWLRPLIEQTPTALFFVAVLLSAWYGGLGPGILATLLGMAALQFFVLSPDSALQMVTAQDMVELAVFLVVALLISTLTAARRQATASARREREQLRVTVASIGDGIITADIHGRVTFMNDAAQALTGWKQTEAAGRPVAEVFRIVHEPSRATAESPATRAMHEELIARLANHTFLITKEGRHIPIDDSSAPIRDGQGGRGGEVLLFRDVTERTRVELFQRLLGDAGQALTSSLDYQDRLISLAQLLTPALADWCAVDMADDAGAIRRVAVAHRDPAKVDLAHELQRRYPLDPDAPRGVPRVLRTGESEFYPDVPDSLLESAALDPEQVQMLRSLGLRAAMVVPLVARGRTLGTLTLAMAETGRCFGPADLALAEELARRAALAVDNARLYAEAQTLNSQLEERILERTRQLRASLNELHREISERQQAEENLRRSREQLRGLAARLQAAREEERTRIAREVHDQLGGAMTGLKMDVAALRQSLRASLLEKTEAMSELIDTTVQAVRRIATELRPAILDDFGLLAAIEWQLQEFQARSGIQCNLTAEVDPVNLDSDSATAVFRVFQETLTNVARHADATQVDVRLAEQENDLILQVRDNGRGISDEEISGARSLGLVGMQERIHLLLGELDIRGAPGQGTTVLVKVPWRKVQAGEAKSGADEHPQ